MRFKKEDPEVKLDAEMIKRLLVCLPLRLTCLLAAATLGGPTKRVQRFLSDKAGYMFVPSAH